MESIGQDELFYQNFHPIDKKSRERFEKFKDENVFGDTSFSLIYAWNTHSNYRYLELEDAIVVVEKDLDGKISCILLKTENTNVFLVISQLYELFYKRKIPFYLKYVSQADIKLYAEIAKRMGKNIKSFSNRDKDDYIYETEAFLDLTGNRNKRKREELNWLHRNFLEIELLFNEGKENENKLKNDCMSIFEKWCLSHKCKDCFLDCEKKVFSNFLEIFDTNFHNMAVCYWNNQPLAFTTSERINKDTLCYYFQKNAMPVKGLTYFLNREMLLRCESIKYINLEEDLGLAGLRMYKESLHPCQLKQKFLIEIF